MKTCGNCRCVYPDDYSGTCSDCGAAMGGTAANGGSGLAFNYARQTAQGQRESAQEMRMRRGDYSGVKLEESILDVARSFVVVDEEKLKQLGGDPSELR